MEFKSQYGQDKYIIERLNYQKKGYFVDVGAAHPTHISNTYVLETDFLWSGLLIDADKYFISQLKQYRTSTVIDALIYSKANIIMPYIITGEIESGYGNHISGFGVPHANKIGYTTLTTTTLQTVLTNNNSPNIIDYLNIDVEGAELEVLKSVDLEKYKFRIMTVEGNNQNNPILKYLQPYGYILDSILQTPGLNEQELVIIHKDIL